MNYIEFLSELDKKLKEYFTKHKDYICCKEGCADCCKRGAYPLSQVELEYMMQGYIALDNETKRIVQQNIQNMKRGEECPFLINNKCSIYPYRPIICRVFGLTYVHQANNKNIVKIPFCSTEGKNYHTVYKDGELLIDPIFQRLDTPELLEGYNCGEIRDLIDWLKPEENSNDAS